MAEDDIAARGTYSRLIPHLRAATATPDDCFHALWDGANGIAAGAEPGFSDRVLDGSKVSLVDEEGHPVREYRLFRPWEDRQITNCHRRTCCGQQIAHGSSRPTSTQTPHGSPALTT